MNRNSSAYPGLKPFMGILAVAWLGGCLLSKDKPDSTEEGRAYWKHTIVKDSVSEGVHHLVVLRDFPIGWCNGDSLEDLTGKSFAIKYRLAGDTLRFWIFSDWMDSNVEVQDLYVRSGKGAALAGRWERRKTVLAPDSTRLPDHLKEMVAERDSAYRNEVMLISEQAVEVFYERTPELIVWKLIDSLPTGVSYEFKGPKETRFRKSGEGEVTIQVDDKNDIHIASSNPAHAEYLIPSVPSKCPADTTTPGWYTAFFGLD